MVSVNKITATATATILQQLAPTGVLPAIASRLNVPLKLVPYEHPDTICTAAEEWQQSRINNSIKQKQQQNQPWDITLIAADSDRELQGIDFTSAYCEIQATCMVPTSSSIYTFDDVNQEGVRLSTKGGGAYDLWVTRNWNNPTIGRSRTLEESYLAYINDNDNDVNNADANNDGRKALAGLRPRLVEDLKRDKEGRHRLLEGSFMSVEQAIGCMKVLKDDDGILSPGHEFLYKFVEESRAPGGLIEELIQKHGMIGRLSVPSSVGP
ncbi:hypothetical protein FRACYDRAFT_236310 [Fragilariopsis cylindrus CCMP1102]|uniref:Uncharacterized protein n=1 Tax=Fragilariopsis cylindrus CCMP1102 TaxID=635003 RepID=A0A1E7FQ10_9STRA|nr:hypothetical protein FRACYDRAFT_236310 [Fragilariopsis cylindrus CCMP1102]|eukprot:OEU20238.1 hypothetical protein FRACYDRAFT_236310 [Fragilariopsis cylindrus CCMP1102]